MEATQPEITSERPLVRAIFPDGRVHHWTTGEGVDLSAEAIAEFVRICVMPTSIVEVIKATE